MELALLFELVAQLGEALGDVVLAPDGGVEFFGDAAVDEVLGLGGPGGGVGFVAFATIQHDHFFADGVAKGVEFGVLGFEGGDFELDGGGVGGEGGRLCG